MITFASRKTPSLGFQLQLFVLGLLLLGVCLSAVIQHPSQGVESKTARTETLYRHTETRPTVRDGNAVGESPAPGIRVMPAVVITADAIGAEEAPEPLPAPVAVVQVVEVVPLALLESPDLSRP